MLFTVPNYGKVISWELPRPPRALPPPCISAGGRVAGRLAVRGNPTVPDGARCRGAEVQSRFPALQAGNRSRLARGWRPGPHHPLPAGGAGSRSGGVLTAPGISPSSHTSIEHPGKTESASCQSGWSQRAAQTLSASAEMPPLEALLILTSGRGREETMKVPMLTSQLFFCSRSLSLYTLQHEF